MAIKSSTSIAGSEYNIPFLWQDLDHRIWLRTHNSDILLKKGITAPHAIGAVTPLATSNEDAWSMRLRGEALILQNE